ncbi:hypothetical protein ACWGCW_20020 [Streptomyces sp. NPDC054933]
MPTHRHRPGARRRRPAISDSTGPTGLPTRYVLIVCAGAIATSVATLLLALPLGSRAGARSLLDTYAGVCTLLSLTATVVWGLVSTGTRVLGPRQRLLAQGVHRAATVASLGFLALHIAVKVAERHITLAEGLIPYGVRGRALLIGLGTLSAYLLLLATATGALRGAFAARGRPVRWRVLHACAYPAWFTAVVHGLKSGRPAAGWVVACYVVCLVAVAAALVVRARRGTPDGARFGGRRRPYGAQRRKAERIAPATHRLAPMASVSTAPGRRRIDHPMGNPR